RVAARRRLVRPADLEDAHAGLLAAEVGREHAEQALQGMLAQRGGVLAERVQQLQRAGGAQGRRLRGIAERPGDALRKAGADEDLTHEPLLAPGVAVAGRRDVAAAERRGDAVVAPDANDLLDQVVLDRDVAAEARDVDLEIAAARPHGQAEARQDPPRHRRWRRQAEHALHARPPQPYADRASLARVRVDPAAGDG